MYSSKDIAIVILNWNGQALLNQFLPSVTRFSDHAKIYVIDNDSTDQSISFLKTTYPQIHIIQNASNMGYAGGYNQAIPHISEPLLCLLNNDVEVTEHWLDPIIEAFNTSQNLAIAQPKLLDYKNKSYFEYAGAAGGYIDKYGYPFCRGRIFNTLEKDRGQYEDTTDIFWASGACFFVKSTVFKHLKGFDETFFAHMEEIDLCWRAFNENYSTQYIGKSVVYHLGGGTLRNSSPKKTYLNFRNSLYALVKNTDSKVVGRTVIRLCLDGLAALRFLIKLQPQHILAILHAHLSFYISLNSLINQRKSLPKRPNYYETDSIVWSYFVKGKRKK
jgi:GT2 family glycosyltransferase